MNVIFATAMNQLISYYWFSVIIICTVVKVLRKKDNCLFFVCVSSDVYALTTVTTVQSKFKCLI